mmetsp:Transcript_63667/g.125015  ORF Transcript_63667/g.125015 Transcript_63667/m.125015 type:complete len:321 (-) Transcript_63667:221-1183(-)|eukprot:CAMPEP_0171600366 /NCGR_PEP_ID=MMETSP0990-20121206/4277_1 /TAXON_ID=483369 /ORGANISM="non described non described, Strain CCMP2098" /LENGTH=320 /DNA_ID=CAMNT_0012162303 /DNA_START=283 /DNA_END=1245 /DNA_ORIENTATION=-
MNDVLIDLTAGSIGGGIGCLCGHPLDTVKVHMQRSYFSSTAAAVSRIFSSEGSRGFFKGVTPPLAAVAMYQAVCFASFSLAFKAVAPGQLEENASLRSLFVAGSLSGMATVFVTTPTDLLKIRLQLQDAGAGPRYKGMRHCASEVLRQEGLAGFYRGAVATAYRDTLSTGLYFTVYHSVKRAAMQSAYFQQMQNQELGTSSSRSSDANLFATSSSSNGARTCVELMAGGFAGVAAWGCLIPADTVKTRLQSQIPPSPATFGSAALEKQERRFWPTLNRIVEREGFWRLYGGSAPLLTRAFFVNAVTFYAYEETLRFIQTA